MWLASRMARGPKRAPGRWVTAPSQAMPATAKGWRASARGALRKAVSDWKANEVMGDAQAWAASQACTAPPSAGSFQVVAQSSCGR